MKNFIQLFVLCLLIVGGMNTAFATHLAGGELTYAPVPNTRATYQFTLTLYRDCGAGSQTLPNSVNLSASCNGGTATNFNAPLVTQMQLPTNNCINAPNCGDTVPAGQQPPYESYVYQGQVTLGDCASWIVSYSVCCRNHDITTGADGENFYIDAMLNTIAAPGNSSPVFNTIPQLALCVGNTLNYNHGVTEADGDQLTYGIASPLTGFGSPVTYTGGYSATNPFTGAYGLNTTTGAMAFSPTVANEVTVSATSVTETQGGVVIGRVTRDFQVTTLQCNNTPPTVTPPISIKACVGNTINYTVNGGDADGDNVTMSWDNGIAGASFFISGNNTNTPSGNFSWTPTAADLGLHSFTVTVVDDACPQSASQSATYYILVDKCDPCDDLNNNPAFNGTLTYDNNGNGVYTLTDHSTTLATDFPFVKIDWGDSSPISTIAPGGTIAHTFTGYGTFEICLTMYTFIDDLCCHETICRTIVIDPPSCDDVDAGFTINYPVFCSNNNCCISVTHNSTYPPTTVDWDWGDGSPFGSGTTAGHSYPSNGWYTVTMYATYHPSWNPKLCCFKEVKKRIYIHHCGLPHDPSDPKDPREDEAAQQFRFDNGPIVRDLTEEEYNRLVNGRNATSDLPSMTAKAYPNPTDQIVTFEIEADRQAAGQLTIYALNGAIMDQFTGNTNDKLDYNVGNLPSGVYFYDFRAEGMQSAKQKLVVIR